MNPKLAKIRRNKRIRKERFIKKRIKQVKGKDPNSPVFSGLHSPVLKPLPRPLKADSYFCEEDGILLKILENVGTSNRFCVEFGAVDGITASTTRLFLNNGWNGVQLDRRIRMLGPYCGEIKEAHITRENINDVFKECEVPDEVDLLSIDIDGNDYWVWEAMECQARVVIIEVNCSFPVGESKVIEYDPGFRNTTKSIYWGATPLAVKRLGRKRGYSLIHIINRNAFLVKSEFLHSRDKDIPLEDLFVVEHHPYKTRKDKRKWVEID